MATKQLKVNLKTKKPEITFLFEEEIDFPKGFFSLGENSSLRPNRNDTALLYCPEGANWSGVVSQNRFRSKSLDDAEKKIGKRIKLLTVFSGNANAGTGNDGFKVIESLSNLIRKQSKLSKEEMLFSFTGVVGRKFPIQKIKEKFISNLTSFFQSIKNNTHSSKGKKAFSDAILTTDTKAKKCACSLLLGGKEVRIAACAKGAGMIAPNMATMLSYLTTDLDIPFPTLHKIQKECVSRSFNNISVDGDRSTNDSFFMFSSGKSLVKWKTLSTEEKEIFINAIREITTHLAHAIVRDGEGATKFITICVKNASSEKEARQVADTIRSSLLVKTAIFGNDPNYGRIIVASGNAGVFIDQKKYTLSFGDHLLFSNGAVKEENISHTENYLKTNKDIDITVSLGTGKDSWTTWTCDISYEYVKINAEYTT